MRPGARQMATNFCKKHPESAHGEEAFCCECEEDYFGYVKGLQRRIAELQETLRLIQWGSCDGCTMPGQFCPQCKNREEDGHTAECFVGQALKP